MLKNWTRDRRKTNIVFGIFIILVIIVSWIISTSLYSIFFETKKEFSSNVFGLTSETVSIENKNDGILNDVAYLFNMQEVETSVITNDNEVFFIKVILNNESEYIVIVRSSEGVATILLDNEWVNQNERLKEHVKKQIVILREKLSNK